jgi:hypothetical protein
MSEEKKDQKPKAPISFDHIGGNKVGHPVPVKVERPIDFSSIGGKCVREACDHPTVKAAPAEPSKDAR